MCIGRFIEVVIIKSTKIARIRTLIVNNCAEIRSNPPCQIQPIKKK